MDIHGQKSERLVLIAGHSHVYTFQFSSYAGDRSPAVLPVPIAPPYVRGFATTAGPYERSYWEDLIDHAADADIIILWQGSQHLAEFLFQHPSPFDFVVATHPHLPIEAESRIVPESLVREYQCRFLIDLDWVLMRLAERPSGRTFVCETPPPKGDDAALRELMIGEPYFQDRARSIGLDLSQVQLSPRILRLKLWIVIHELVKELANKHGAGYVEAPKAAIDPDGFLKPEFWERDVGHGNSRYGHLLLDNVLCAMHR